MIPAPPRVPTPPTRPAPPLPLAIVYADHVDRARTWRGRPSSTGLLEGYRVLEISDRSATRARGRTAHLVVEVDPMTDQALEAIAPAAISAAWLRVVR